MAFFKSKRRPSHALVNDREFNCLVCGGNTFTNRDIKLNSTGFEAMGVEWLNRAAIGLICVSCGYVHEFVGNSVRLWNEDD